MTLSKKLSEEAKRIGKEFSESKDEKKALSQIKKAICGSDKKCSDRTQSVRYSQFKKIISTFTNNIEFLKKIKPHDEITKRLIIKNTEIRDNKKMLIIPREIMVKLISLKNSINPYDIALYLLLMSGRRISEILEAKFSLSSIKGHIKMEGAKKTRFNDSVLDFKPIGTPKAFLRHLKKFRKLEVNPITYPRMLGLRLKKLLGNEWHPHMLRGLYAIYLFKFDNPDLLKINSFIQSALNHKTIGASLSYTGYSIKDVSSKLKGVN